MKAKTIDLEFTVRDYELDLQGIVNNAVYLNYLEHARHEYLKHFGLDFSALHHEGYDAVVIRAEVDYKRSLRSGDAFMVRTCIERQGRLRLVFVQQILRKHDEALIVDARIIAACIYRNRPVEPHKILEKIGLV